MFKKTNCLICLFVFVALSLACKRAVPGIFEDCKYESIYALDCGKDLLAGYPAENRDGTVNAVVEIPAGTNAKWEVNATLQDGTKPTDGKLRWEFKNGKPRVVQYLAYPGNYGLIPNTRGGDGDALDIILLGPSVPRGSVIQAKCIGVLKMIDGGDIDDKIVGVIPMSPFSNIETITDLEEQFPGVRDIIEIWFTHYKRNNEIFIKGWGDKLEAERILQQARVKMNQ